MSPLSADDLTLWGKYLGFYLPLWSWYPYFSAGWSSCPRSWKSTHPNWTVCGAEFWINKKKAMQLFCFDILYLILLLFIVIMHHADILAFSGSSVPLLYKNTLKWFSFHTFLTSERKRLIELEHIFLMVLCNDLLYKHLDFCTSILWTNYTSKMNKNTEDLKNCI